MRAVVDTNILIRALIKPEGSVGPILSRLAAGEFVLVLSEPILDEFVATVSLPRIREKYRIDDQAVATVLDLFAWRGLLVIANKKVAVCRDPKDNMFLEASDEAGASWIVTGDEDLLVLGSHGTARIDTPSAFLSHLGRCKDE